MKASLLISRAVLLVFASSASVYAVAQTSAGGSGAAAGAAIGASQATSTGQAQGANQSSTQAVPQTQTQSTQAVAPTTGNSAISAPLGTFSPSNPNSSGTTNATGGTSSAPGFSPGTSPGGPGSAGSLYSPMAVPPANNVGGADTSYGFERRSSTLDSDGDGITDDIDAVNDRNNSTSGTTSSPTIVDDPAAP
ncbi:MAG: hypothetical protein V4692_05945 [Bdellovibrionota bacterium]